jgi:hypothetical protein
MVYRKREKSRPPLNRFSDALQELELIGRIENPEEKIEILEDFSARLLDFAKQTGDREIIRIAEEYAAMERRSIDFFRAEILESNIRQLRSTLEVAREIVAPPPLNKFLECTEAFEHVLEENKRMAFSSVKALSTITNQLTRELIGRRLEKEVVPDLAKQIGYSRSPNIIPDNGGEIETDFVGERNTTTSPLGDGKWRTKEVLVVESKTTISERAIKNFSRKVEIIKSKYEKTSTIFKYKLVLKAWILACYGWTDDLRKMATDMGIEPFDKDRIEDLLKAHNLLDRRIPICP